MEGQRATQERASKDHLGIYARSQKKDQKEAEPKMIKARAVTIVKIQALIDFYHFAVPFSQFIPLIRELFLYRICTFKSTTILKPFQNKKGQKKLRYPTKKT